jgi:hypothetical protein
VITSKLIINLKFKKSSNRELYIASKIKIGNKTLKVRLLKSTKEAVLTKPIRLMLYPTIIFINSGKTIDKETIKLLNIYNPISLLSYYKC